MTSATMGQFASLMSSMFLGSTTRSEYPNMVPLSQTMTFGLPVDRIFSAEFLITLLAQNWPFLMLMMAPVLPAATRRSVWRHKKAGICMMSATWAAGTGGENRARESQRREESAKTERERERGGGSTLATGSACHGS